MRILYQITTCLILTAIVVEICILLTLNSTYPSDQWPNDSYNIRNIDLRRLDVSLQQQLRLSDSANDSASRQKDSYVNVHSSDGSYPQSTSESTLQQDDSFSHGKSDSATSDSRSRAWCPGCINYLQYPPILQPKINSRNIWI